MTGGAIEQAHFPMHVRRQRRLGFLRAQGGGDGRALGGVQVKLRDGGRRLGREATEGGVEFAKRFGEI